MLWSYRSHILLQNLFAFLVSGCWYDFAQFCPYCWKNIFSFFWNVLFCLYCLVLSWYLFSLPSFASFFFFFFFFFGGVFFSSFIHRSSCLDFPVSFEYFLIFRFSILTCCHNLFCFFVILDWVSNWVLTFCLFDFLSGWLSVFHRLILLLRILNRLTPCGRLSGYLSISHSLSRFRNWLSSCVGSWENAMCFLFRHDSLNDIYINFLLLGKCLRLFACGVSVIVMRCFLRSSWLSCI